MKYYQAELNKVVVFECVASGIQDFYNKGIDCGKLKEGTAYVITKWDMVVDDYFIERCYGTKEKVMNKNLDEISTTELIEELKKRDKIRVESAYKTEIISIGDRIDERIVFKMDDSIVLILNKG